MHDKPIRKITEFDQLTWVALKILSQDSMKGLQELIDEAVSDLLTKHRRPAVFKDALRDSVAQAKPPTRPPRGSKDRLP